MLSIGLVRSSGAAVSYYEKDDYYHAQDSRVLPAQGEWFGRGAAQLGLSGAVEPTQFKKMLQGELPNGVVLGTVSKEERQHTPGWDLTFSAPKSVSVLVEAGRDERLLAAQNVAVKEALAWAEQHSTGSRMRTMLGRLFMRNHSMVAALFTHHTSRNQDPNLHTHSVVANATERMDGRWVSVHSQVLFDHKMALGVIYRAALAREVQRLGYEIDVTHRDGRFEIRGVPDELIREFSSRRREIKDAMQERGLDGAADAAKAALMTRVHKRVVDHAELVELWRSVIEAKGFDVDEFIERARAAGPQSPGSGLPLDTALKEAIERVCESEAVFSQADLVRFTLASMVGRADVRDVENAILGAQRQGRLLRVDEAGLEQWTTVRAKQQELHILNTMLRGQAQHEPIASEAEVRAELKGRKLNPEQRAAVEYILTSADRFINVRGLPGTGKTTYMLKAVRELAQARGFEPRGMAQNAKAAGNLGEEAGMPATTIHKHLISVGKDLAALKGAGALRATFIRQRYQKQVWVVDESSQLPNGLKRRLMFAADRLGARMIDVGDDKQMQPIEAGKPFNFLLGRGRYAQLTEMQRQQKTVHREAVLKARAGLAHDALNLLGDSVHIVQERDQRLTRMLDTYRELGELRKDTLLLTVRNAEKRLLNVGVRKILADEGKISDAREREQLVRVVSSRADRRDAAFYEKGWTVRFAQNIPVIGVKEREYWEVQDVDKANNILKLQRRSGEGTDVIHWNPREVGAADKRVLQIYKPEKTTLAVGEPVRWNDNRGKVLSTDGKKVPLINGQILRTVRVEQDSTTFATESGQHITIDHRAMGGRHWDHDYATTVYSSQGRTALVALVDAASSLGKLFSQKAFIVALSRHKQRIEFFTDNREALEESLQRHDGEKTSAIEAIERAAALRAAGLSIDSTWREAAREIAGPERTRSMH